MSLPTQMVLLALLGASVVLLWRIWRLLGRLERSVWRLLLVQTHLRDTETLRRMVDYAPPAAGEGGA